MIRDKQVLSLLFIREENLLMINSVQETPLVLASNTANISFENDVLRTRNANCCGFLDHTEGSSLYQIIKAGVYEVSVNANITSATAGVVALAIKLNGEPLQGSEMDSEVTTADTYDNVAATRLIRVCCNSSATITVGSVPTIEGVATVIPTVKDVSLIIKKIA